MWKRVTLLFAGLMLAGNLNAASLSTSELPDGSDWFLHVNVELMRTSTIGKMMMDESIGEAFEEIESEIGVKFTHEIDGLTVFGAQLPPESGAVIAHARFSDETRFQLIDAMSKARTFIEAEHAGFAYYAIDDLDGKRGHKHHNSSDDVGVERRYSDDDDLLYVAFGNGQTLFSKNLEMVQNFLAGGGYLPGLDNGDPSTLLVIEADRAMLQGGINTKGRTGHGEWDSSILSNVDRVTAVLIDDNGAASFHADVLAKSPEIAESVRNIVEGLVALKALDAADEPMIGELLRSTSIQTSGANITIDVFIESQLLTELLDR